MIVIPIITKGLFSIQFKLTISFYTKKSACNRSLTKPSLKCANQILKKKRDRRAFSPCIEIILFENVIIIIQTNVNKM